MEHQNTGGTPAEHRNTGGTLAEQQNTGRPRNNETFEKQQNNITKQHQEILPIQTDDILNIK